MDGNIIFRPAVEPLEAAVLPAKQKRPLGALHLAQSYWTDTFCCFEHTNCVCMRQVKADKQLNCRQSR